jgi:tRNA-uridine 2-sulfurtransferase
MPKVIVGMSGGVDSSVTAYLLKEQGYEVEGVSFRLYEPESPEACASCCSQRSVEEASKTAQHLGIPHRTVDARRDFVDKVIGPFVDAYLNGATPNPCVLCNRHIKFPYLIKESEGRGAEFISTGHYARVEKLHCEDDIMSSLKKGFDQKKDQSYVLYVLKQEQLSRLILPLGHHTKDDVRKTAGVLKLPSAGKDESQEICFVEDGKYLRFIEERSPGAAVPGPIVDTGGRVIGTHSGIHSYTIGQRKGMGISSPEPLYVIKIDTERNTIYAGPREAAVKREFLVGDLNWIDPSFADLTNRQEDAFRATVKVRSTMKDQPATIHSSSPSSLTPHPSSFAIVRVCFDEPQWAPAPGQSAVFYDGDIVIGGGIIL